MTTTQTIKQRKLSTQHHLQLALGYTAEDLFWHRVDSGIDLLNNLIPHSPHSIKMEILGTPIFWNWWINVLYLQDAELCSVLPMEALIGYEKENWQVEHKLMYSAAHMLHDKVLKTMIYKGYDMVIRNINK